MGAKWMSIIALLLALITEIHCLLEEPPQSLALGGGEGSVTGKGKPLLQELYDHAEYKGLPPKDEEMMENPSTTEVPDPLPTPVAVKQDDSDFGALDTEKKLSVPKKGAPSKKPSVVPKKEVHFAPSVVAKKGVSSKKPSVVPKKEVHFAPSVVAKKGADPESSTPSVSPRKGVELSQGSSVHDLLLMSSENMNNTNISPSSSGTIDSDGTGSKSNSEKEAKQKLNTIPIPQLVQKGKLNDSQFSVQGNSSSQPSSDFTSKPSATSSKSESVPNLTHFKPTTADDAGATITQVSYATIFTIIALVVLVVVVVVVGYHKLKDIWMRRHYDYVDFLIDGMYE